MRVFDNTIANRRAKLVLDTSKSVSLEGDKVDDDLLFYVDKQGESENGSDKDTAMDESVNAALVTVARTMSTTENGSGKKRQRKTKRKNKNIKFVKYDLVPNSDATTQLRSAIDNNNTDSEGEVHNPHSDEDSDMK